MESKCPDYYRLADGRTFDEFFEAECVPLVEDELSFMEFHWLAEACQYRFRQGLKPGQEESDKRKFERRIKTCQDSFVLRNFEIDPGLASIRFGKMVVPVINKVATERAKKSECAKK